MNVEQLIRSYVALPQKPSSQGWFPVLCKVCNDSGRKGPRAGFMFTDNGETAAYHCFNCSLKTSFSSTTSRRFSRAFAGLLAANNIPHTESAKVLEHAFLNMSDADRMELERHRQKEADYEASVVKLPSNAYPLTDSDPDDFMAQIAIDYLSSRKVDWKSQPFFLARYTGNEILDRWATRLIIPIYKDKELIYYTGRDLSNMMPRKYLNVSTDSANVMYGFDKLNQNSAAPLYVTEGWFDAYVVDGVAVFGNDLSKGQEYWLTRSNRRKVVIPDKHPSGFKLASRGIELGWEVATPDIGDCDDINSAVVTYGKLYVLNSLRENTHSGTTALMLSELYCNE